jgi:general secretion pathway protein K
MHSAPRNNQYAKRDTQFATGPDSGIALIIVMVCIFVLSILAGGFAYSMKVETKLAHNANNETELEWMGRSTVEYCRWVRAMQDLPAVRVQEPYDTLDQVWAGGPGSPGTTNSPLANVQTTLHFRNGTTTWKMIDLERKLNINLAPEGTLRAAMMVNGADESETAPVVNSILDWIDTDNATRPSGAETDYYQTQDPPYEAKNGPIDDLSELLLIKNVTPEMCFGGASTNHPANRFLPAFDRFGAPTAHSYSPGFFELFTPISSGLINIYTASKEVIAVVLGGDAMAQQAAEQVITLRGAVSDDTAQLAPGTSRYMAPRDLLVSAGLSQQAAAQMGALFVGRSATFQVEVDAEMSGYHRKFIAILGQQPGNKDIKVLNFYWKD